LSRSLIAWILTLLTVVNDAV